MSQIFRISIVHVSVKFRIAWQQSVAKVRSYTRDIAAVRPMVQELIFVLFSSIYQAIDAITKTTAPYLHTKESREDFQRKIKEAMRKPTQKKRKTPEDEWVLLPRDKPVAVPVGDTHVAGDQRSLRERFWHFVDTHCHIL